VDGQAERRGKMSMRDEIIRVARGELGSADNRDIQDIHELDKYFRDVGKNPNGADKTTSWCGIFACWVLQQAGLPVRWNCKIVDATNRRLKLIDANCDPQKGGGDKGKGIQRGDVGVILHRTHHFIVEEAFPGEDLLLTISGNYLGRQHDCITRTREYKRSGLYYYYRIMDD